MLDNIVNYIQDEHPIILVVEALILCTFIAAIYSLGYSIPKRKEAMLECTKECLETSRMPFGTDVVSPTVKECYEACDLCVD